MEQRAQSQRWAAVLFLALVPFAVWLTNANVLGNTNGDVDTWFYLGHFIGLGKYSNYQFAGPGDYYATRLAYILPGYLIFHLFPLAWAKMVFAYLVYAVTISAMFYTLRAHMAERTAALVLTLLASDLFFTRAMNWNYVDTGVIVYQALTFAALTAAKSSERKALWVGIAAFLFTCSVFTHLGVSMSIFAVALYAWLCLDPRKLTRKAFMRLVYGALAGVAACQIIIGALNVWINRGDFFFFPLLYKVASGETHSLYAWEPPLHLIHDRAWLAIPFAVWVGTGITLSAGLLRLVRLERAQVTMMLMAFFTCSLLFTLDQLHISYYLSRSGMYASLYLVVFYIGAAALLTRSPPLSWTATMTIGAFFLCALLLRLHYNATGVPWLPPTNGVWIAGLAIGLLLAAAFLVPRPALRIAVLCLAAIPTLFIQWKFEDTRDAYTAFQAMRKMAGNELPHIWAQSSDPLYRDAILPMIASFTERGWWVRGDNFPNDPPGAWDDDIVFVASSTIHSLEQARKLIAPHVDRIEPVRSQVLHLSRGDLWIGEFRGWNRIGFLGRTSAKGLTEANLIEAKVPAASLPSFHGRIEGGSRIGVEGDAGKLTFGPYLSLAPGKYLITIVYGPSSAGQTWDIALQRDNHATVIADGAIPATQRHDARIATTLDLKQKATGVEIRTYYSGAGQLAIHAIGVKPLSAH